MTSIYECNGKMQHHKHIGSAFGMGYHHPLQARNDGMNYFTLRMVPIEFDYESMIELNHNYFIDRD